MKLIKMKQNFWISVKSRNWLKILFHFHPQVWISSNIHFQWKCCRNFNWRWIYLYSKSLVSSFSNFKYYSLMWTVSNQVKYFLFISMKFTIYNYQLSLMWVQIIRLTKRVWVNFEDPFTYSLNAANSIVIEIF